MSADELIVHQDPDAPGAEPGKLAAPLPVLNEDGEVVKRADELPADFPDTAALQQDGSVILTLRYPVTLRFKEPDGTVRADTFSTLHMKRLKGKQQRELMAAQGTDDYRPQMLASSTGLSLGRCRLLHDEMDAADIAAAMRVVIFFITPGRRTGP